MSEYSGTVVRISAADVSFFGGVSNWYGVRTPTYHVFL